LNKFLMRALVVLVGVLISTAAYTRPTTPVTECFDSSDAVYTKYGAGKVWASWTRQGHHRKRCYFAAELHNHRVPTAKSAPEKQERVLPPVYASAGPIKVNTKMVSVREPKTYTMVTDNRPLGLTSEESQALTSWMTPSLKDPWTTAITPVYQLTSGEVTDADFKVRFTAYRGFSTIWRSVEVRK
jgi:hypothetical protein